MMFKLAMMAALAQKAAGTKITMARFEPNKTLATLVNPTHYGASCDALASCDASIYTPSRV